MKDYNRTISITKEGRRYDSPPCLGLDSLCDNGE